MILSNLGNLEKKEKTALDLPNYVSVNPLNIIYVYIM